MREAPIKSVDLHKLGTALVAGAAVIYAIRTARREISRLDPHCANREVESEVEYAVEIAKRIIAHAISRHESYFEQQVEEFTTGVVEEDVPL